MSDLSSDPRAVLATYLNVDFEDWQQDWEYEISGEVEFDKCFELYESDYITDDHRESLLEIMLDKVANEFIGEEGNITYLDWFKLEAIIKNNTLLHKDTLRYWRKFNSNHEYAPISRRLDAIFGELEDGV